jgi:hypothetical protein
MAALAASCLAQTSPGAEQRRAGGERTITGCLQRQGSGFVIKASDGTYALDTDRDLSAFVGKQIKISGRWESSGTFTTAPVGNAPSQSAPSSSSEPNAPTPAFVGDLHLHITGTVIGDCAAQK